MNRKAYTVVVAFAASYLLLLLGLLSVLYAALWEFAIPNGEFIIICAALFAVLFLLIYHGLPKPKMKFILWVLAWLWLGCGILWRKDILLGASVASGYVTPYLSKLIRWEFAAVAAPMPGDERAAVIFLLFCLFPYAGLLAFGVARRSRWLSVLLTAPLFLCTVALRCLPSDWVLTPLFAFWLVMIVSGNPSRRAFMQKPAVSTACMGISIVLAFGLLTAFPQQTYDMQTAVQLRESAINYWTNLNFSGPFGGVPGIAGSPLAAPNGTTNLNATGQLRFSDKTALRVHMYRPQTLYLRGFAASVYTGHSWEHSENESYDSSAFGLDQPLAYLESEDQQYFVQPPQMVTIDIKGSNPRFVYMPYLFAGIDGSVKPTYFQDEYMLAEPGVTSYQMGTYAGAGYTYILGTGYTDSPKDLWRRIMGMDRSIEAGTISINGHDLSIRKSLLGPGFMGLMTHPPLADVADHYQGQPGSVFLDDFYPSGKRDGAYIRYIYDQYTQLPDGLRESLAKWWGDGDDVSQMPFWNWRYAAELVAERVRDSGIYTASPGAQPYNRDFVAYFLNTRNQGYCVHFASATTVLLRMLGIPARYVEGYVVDEAEFDKDGWASVPAKNAHAWAEIWLPDMGWVPVESTPGGSHASRLANGQTDTPSSSAGPRASSDFVPPPTPRPTPRHTPSPSPKPTNSPNSPIAQSNPHKPSGGEAGFWAKNSGLLIRTGWILLCGAILSAGLYSIRIYVTFRRKRQFADGDPNRAALYIYAYLERLAAFGIPVSGEAVALAQKARFSQHRLTKDERGILLSEAAKQREQTKRQLAPMQKLLFWLRVL